MIRITLWTAAFLIVLRVAIGWHFFFEGLNKVKSAYAGESEVVKPFSSEIYFRESEGPIGPAMRSYMGDFDEQLFALLNVNPTTGEINAEEFPKALAEEWDAYLIAYLKFFPVPNEEQDKITTKIYDPLRKVYLQWLAGKIPSKTELEKSDDSFKSLKLKAADKLMSVSYGGVTVDRKMNLAQRVKDFLDKRKAVQDAVQERMAEFGKDVEKAALRTKKAEVTTARNELIKDIAEFTTEFKDRLAKLAPAGLASFKLPADKANLDVAIDENVLATLKFKGETNDVFPPLLQSHLSAYREAVQTIAAKNPEDVKLPPASEIDQLMLSAALRFNRYGKDQDEFTGLAKPELSTNVLPRLAAYEKALQEFKTKPSANIEAEIRRLRQSFEVEFKRHLDTVRADIGGLTAEQQKGYVEVPAKTKPVQNIDRLTRWFLTIIGSCLLFGVFTRLSSLAAAGFLVMTYLAQPSFPWIPAPPVSEGNYVFVNKNVIEFLALMVLATVPTGRWLGIDGLIHYWFGPKEKVEE